MPNVGTLALGFLLQSSGFSLSQSMGDQVSGGDKKGLFCEDGLGKHTHTYKNSSTWIDIYQ